MLQKRIIVLNCVNEHLFTNGIPHTTVFDQGVLNSLNRINIAQFFHPAFNTTP